MVKINIEMPTDCASCQLRKIMGCKIANASGWLNNKRDESCLLEQAEATKSEDKKVVIK